MASSRFRNCALIPLLAFSLANAALADLPEAFSGERPTATSYNGIERRLPFHQSLQAAKFDAAQIVQPKTKKQPSGKNKQPKGKQQPKAKQPRLNQQPDPRNEPRLDPFAFIAGETTRGRLARAPDAIGDFFNVGAFTLNNAFVGRNGTFEPISANANLDLPLPGGRRVKISEHNKALPVDRVYVLFHHFENAVTFESALRVAPLNQVVGADFLRRESMDRYTFGLEKTFDCGWSSLELRMPLADAPRLNEEGVAGDFGSVGNLTVSLKRLLWLCDRGSVVAGLGVSLPTGEDTAVRIVARTVTVENQAVHLLPYVGFLAKPAPRIFIHGFAQLDVDANGNRIVDRVVDKNLLTSTIDVTSRRLTDPTLLFLDFSAGYWLYRQDCRCGRPRRGITGLAALVEVHMTRSLENLEIVQLGQNAILAARSDHVAVTNLTVGLHLELSVCTALRVAGVFPLGDGPNRFFDSEFIIHLNRRF